MYPVICLVCGPDDLRIRRTTMKFENGSLHSTVSVTPILNNIIISVSYYFMKCRIRTLYIAVPVMLLLLSTRERGRARHELQYLNFIIRSIGP